MWNYRVIRTEYETGIVTFRIHEVYYDDNGSIDLWSTEPVSPSGESPDELREDLEHFMAALDKEVLEEVEENGKLILRPVFSYQENR